MKIAIYNENCVQAGKQVGDRELEQAEAENEGTGRDPWEDGDWTVWEDTPETLLAAAESRELNARTGGGGSYDRRVAETIREAVYDERPELRPEDED